MLYKDLKVWEMARYLPRSFLTLFLVSLFVALGIVQFLAFQKASGRPGVPALECRTGCVEFVSPPRTTLDLSESPQSIEAMEAGRGSFLGDFDLSLDLKAGRPTGDWRVFFVRGQDPERLPLIALHPGVNRLHLRISSARDWNDGTDSYVRLPENQWVKVTWKYRRNGDSLLLLENLDEPEPIPFMEKWHIGAVGDFGTYSSVEFLQADGVQVRNFTLTHN